MSAIMWSDVDGMVSASPDTTLKQLLQDSHAKGLHLGTRYAHHATLQDALDANDAVWSHRIVLASVEALSGDLSGPTAPRAAVGPDLACFALGTRNQIRSVTLRAERVARWARVDVESINQGIVIAQELAERGCTLVEIRGKTLHAALPRPSLASLVKTGDPPPLVEEASHLTWPIPWRIVPDIWERLGSDLDKFGSLMIHGLDPHLCVLRLVGEGTEDKAELRAIMIRHLGMTTTIPPDIARALRIRPLETGRPRA